MSGVNNSGSRLALNVATEALFFGLFAANSADRDTVSGVIFTFEDDTFSVTNGYYDATEEKYISNVAGTQLYNADGLSFGNMTMYGGLASAFDTTLYQVHTSSAALDQTVGTCGKEWYSGAKVIAYANVYSTTDRGLRYTAGPDTLELVGCDSDGGNEVVLGTLNYTNAVSTKYTVTASVFSAHEKHFIRNTCGLYPYFSEIEFFEQTPTPNIQGESVAFDFSAVTAAQAFFLASGDFDATDLGFQVSGDNGVTWSAAAYCYEPNSAVGDDRLLVSAFANIPGDGAETVFRFTSRNNKNISLKGMGIVGV